MDISTLPTRQQPIVVLDITLPSGKDINLTMVPEMGDTFTQDDQYFLLRFPGQQMDVTLIKANIAALSVRHTSRLVPDVTPAELDVFLKHRDHH